MDKWKLKLNANVPIKTFFYLNYGLYLSTVLEILKIHSMSEED